MQLSLTKVVEVWGAVPEEQLLGTDSGSKDGVLSLFPAAKFLNSRFASTNYCMKQVEIFTDGACKGNPGPGGWGAILRYRGVVKELFGAEPQTTNNRMELTAVIKALEALREPCEVALITDSQYVVNGVNKGWAESWSVHGWRNAKNQAVANPDLWEILLTLLRTHTVKFLWVKGHAGHPENERCDELAVNAYSKYN